MSCLGVDFSTHLFAFCQMPGYCAAAAVAKVTVNRGLMG